MRMVSLLSIIFLTGVCVSLDALAAPPQTLHRLDCGDGQVPVFQQASSAWICGNVNGAQIPQVVDANNLLVGTFVQDDLVVMTSEA